MKTYKLDGVKYTNLEELKMIFWEIYKEKMSKEQFEKYVKENVQIKDEEIKDE